MTEENEVKIDSKSLARGAINEKLDECIEQVMENILDPNMPRKKTREVIMKIIFKPVARGVVDFAIDCYPKLAIPHAVESSGFVGLQGGRAVFFENNPNQQTMFAEPANAVKLNKKEKV